MSKGLEALKRIKPYANSSIDGELDIIEKELKEKETQDDYIQVLEDRIDNLETTYSRYKKALEIISKGFNMWVEEIKAYKGNPIYRLVLCYNLSDRFYLNITKEEYDFLKEVLL